MITMFTYVPANFPSNYVLDYHGLKAGLLVGTLLTAAGAWVKTLVSRGFFWLYVGQTLWGLAQPFILNAQGKIAVNWFPQEHVGAATTIAVSANVFGVAVGYFFPAIFVSASDVDFPDRAASHIEQLFRAMAIFATVVAGLVILFFRSRPAVSPSAVASAAKEPLCLSLKSLLRKRNFLLLTSAFSLIVGLWMTISTIIGELGASYDYDSTQIAIMGQGFTLFGLIGNIVLGLYAARTRAYRFILLWSNTATLAALLAF